MHAAAVRTALIGRPSRALRALALALVCAALGLVPACASVPFQRGDTGAPGPAAVTGQVTSDQGAILVDVVVRLNGPSFRRTTRTDIAGRFSFDRVPLGQYTLSAAAEGYKSARQKVVVDKEAAVKVMVQMKM